MICVHAYMASCEDLQDSGPCSISCRRMLVSRNGVCAVKRYQVVDLECCCSCQSVHPGEARELGPHQTLEWAVDAELFRVISQLTTPALHTVEILLHKSSVLHTPSNFPPIRQSRPSHVVRDDFPGYKAVAPPGRRSHPVPRDNKMPRPSTEILHRASQR